MSSQHICFIHCADLHLDSRMESRLSRFQAQNRRKELLQTFLRMADYAAQHDVRAILISGDLFDTEHTSASTIKRFLSGVQEHPDVDFLYLPGNHDMQIFNHPAFEMNWPDNLWLLRSTGISSETVSHTVTQKSYGQIVITGLTGDVTQLPSLSPSHVNLVMLHGQIYQHALSSESSMGNILNYSLKDLSGRNIDYIAAGHIHQYQCGSIDNRGYYCYSGCLEGRGFDECGEKGFVLLDISTPDPDSSPADGTGKAQLSFQLIPFAARRFYDLNLDLTDCSDYQSACQQVDQIFSAIDNSHLVRLKLTGRIPPGSNLHIDWLIEKYIDDFYLLHIEDCTKPAVSYEDYRYDISLKGEFIRLVLSDPELKDEDKEKVIKEGLHVLAGEEVILG